jgi:hypothetical protein
MRKLAVTSKKEKKIQILNFEFQNSNFKKKKKKKGVKPFVRYIFFDEPRSSQAIEPLS